ncbi:hypothetical protein Back11_03820 [Paenibacillus baekrokdamisoli]|uniref:Uncharacterized protein n=1 Tax=Paenibacillus baekrokdamisoli TaxID=1712516 RepID=A0A3G9IJ56_9BACL|nr:extracellular solute-binding protein [Paenibacillus baekrokdamisoli]MBB3067781.1 raffinose/stachyose/melibiose transport system substrate-binding protein [Paenibacillus baekrokdamisoli]BBH19037.1 hypothetical protein Back11_03820 [Paenibacillus baekrokdamisoli]
MKKLLSVSLLLALSVVTAACGGKNENNPTTNKPKTNNTAPAKVTTIKMLHWQQDNINAAIEKINADFEKEFPQYKVEYTKTEPNDVYKQAMRTHLTANDIDIFPDLSAMRSSPKDYTPGAKIPDWQQWIDNGLIADLSGQAFVKNYNASDIAKGGTYNGKVYAIPAGSFAMGGLFFNKKIFDENGLKIPTTWSEFVALNEALLAKNITPIGLAGKDVWPLKLPAFNLQAQLLAGGNQEAWLEGIWKGTNKFNDADAVEVLEKMKTIQDKYTIKNFMGIGYGDLPKLFATGKVAMIADGSWDITTIQAADPNLDFGYFPLPASDKPVDVLAGKYDMTWYVAEKGPNKEGALKWLEYFSRPEVYQKFVTATGMLPIQPNIATGNKVNDDYIVQWVPKMQTAYEILMIDRDNVGEHIATEGVHTEFLSPGGPFKTAKELADVQQKEWEAAAPK